ncbi:hypothetical protein FDP25_10610 [Roseovarius sp. A21]|uniref:DUF4399 domain-containing protein n=1 Tax=Roseovarius bejariae TaxID=2576383 RepID=A0A844CM65_9RHOB|nr:hypothetical protein [Roseovarius bejariae]MRU15877.1 hypothetical protein [Roseovarius bejariae]
MPRTFIFLLIGLFFGTGLGFLVAASTGAQLEGHEHTGDTAHDHAAHDHGQGDISGHDHSKLTEAGTPTPTLALSIHPDSDQSRNLHIETSNFTFDPAGVNGPHEPGHGHAHIYINGVKQPRAYSPWAQLNALPIGTHEVRVTLNANDHSQLAIDGTPIEATTTIEIE